MKKVDRSYKKRIVSILLESFKNNKSVEFIAGKDHKSKEFLMEYSFETCMRHGEVFLSDDGKGCALLQYFDKSKFSFKGVWWDFLLILKSVGILNIRKILTRESYIKSQYPDLKFTYLWFIGVDPEGQGSGTGSTLLREVLAYSDSRGRPVYLETSTLKNLPWYQKHGFTVYHQTDRFGFQFYFLRTGGSHDSI